MTEFQEAIHEVADSLYFCDTYDDPVKGERSIWEPFEHLSEDDVNSMVDDAAETIERFIRNSWRDIADHYSKPEDYTYKNRDELVAALTQFINFFDTSSKCDDLDAIIKNAEKLINKLK